MPIDWNSPASVPKGTVCGGVGAGQFGDQVAGGVGLHRLQPRDLADGGGGDVGGGVDGAHGGQQDVAGEACQIVLDEVGIGLDDGAHLPVEHAPGWR